jgi:hypothetical protein
VAALPQLPSEEVAFWYRAMVGLLAPHQAGTLADLHPGEPSAAAPEEEEGDAAAEPLVVMLAAMLRAPSATSR